MRRAYDTRLTFVLLAVFATLLSMPLVAAAMSSEVMPDRLGNHSAPGLAPVMALTPPPPNFLLLNYGFEFSSGSSTQASNWDTANLNPKDGRHCPGLNPSDCTFRFRAANVNAAPRRLSQTITPNEYWGEEGETLVLSAGITTYQLSAASRLVLTVTYTDGTTDRAIVRIPSGTNTYRGITTSLTLMKPAESATVIVRVKTGGTAKTRLWVDDLILRVE